MKDEEPKAQPNWDEVRKRTKHLHNLAEMEDAKALLWALGEIVTELRFAINPPKIT